MSSIREAVARAVVAKQMENHDVRGTSLDEADAAITAFLEAAAEQGWHMRPDEATVKMRVAASESAVQPPKDGSRAQTTYGAMLAAAPPFDLE